MLCDYLVIVLGLLLASMLGIVCYLLISDILWESKRKKERQGVNNDEKRQG